MSLKNNKGQTVFEVANASLQEWMQANDPSRINADLLLNELSLEDDHDSKAKQKNALKKQRNKINKIAKAQNDLEEDKLKESYPKQEEEKVSSYANVNDS